MSEHSKILAKYEKMFEDGFPEPIHLSQPQPNMSEMNGAAEEKPNTPLGEPVKKENFQDDESHQPDYTESDAYMEGKINEMRNRGTQDNNPNVPVQNDVIERLKKRIDLLEQALTLVMETQSKMIKG